MLLLGPSFPYWKVQRDPWVFMWRGGMGLLNCDLTLRHLLSNKEKESNASSCFFDRTCTLALSIHFFGCPIPRPSKIARPENGGVERNLFSPNIKIPYRQKFLGSEIFEIFAIFTYFLENKNHGNIHFLKIIKIKTAK